MKVFGHPLHAMIVHFPAALFPFDFVCTVLWYATHTLPLGYGAYFALLGGVLGGWGAALFGVLDMVNIPATKKPVQLAALTHGAINTTVMLGYTVLAYRAWHAYPALPFPGVGMLLGKAALVSLLLLGNYFGGNLVYRFGIGTHQKEESAT
jgi:uncharacterized membrane protein